METGFVKADSGNLPVIDFFMVTRFFNQKDDFFSAEMKGVKRNRSGRETYGDAAIGYVQVKRDFPVCTLIAKVTPEHKIHNKCYKVTATINEDSEEIISAECNDCVAAKGGCKHSIALIYWLLRRSDEPSPTETVCYWKKADLAKVSSLEPFQLEELKNRTQYNYVYCNTNDFFNEICSLNENINNHLERYLPRDDILTIRNLSVHYMAQNFKRCSSSSNDYLEFIKFASKMCSDIVCEGAQAATLKQSQSELWHELRYGRITASKLYEASRCHTEDGSLCESILGARFTETTAIKRGKLLESEVIVETIKAIGEKIYPSGLWIRKEWPVMGASPDGLTTTHVVEVKCPIHLNNLQNYVVNDELKPKYNAQIQMQMFLTGRRRGYFVIADPTFEISKKIQIIEVSLDKESCLSLMEKAMQFWRTSILPRL